MDHVIWLISYNSISSILILARTRAAQPVAQKVWQTSGTKPWQTSDSGRPFLKNRGKDVLWQTSGKAVHAALARTGCGPYHKVHVIWSI